MKKFQFRMQSLFDLAKKREEAARRDLARALEAFRDAELAVEKAVIELERAQEEARSSGSPGAKDPATLITVQAWIMRREAAVGLAKAQCDLAAARYEEARRRLVENRREVVTLERSRDEALAAWRDESNKVELSDLEEGVHARRRKGDEDT